LNLLEKGIILLFLEGKSHEEIAEIVGISTSNVGTKISRIKEKLKSQIKKNADYGT
jgi:RNA polymerase sigma-70 factor (ECF subfamily)